MISGRLGAGWYLFQPLILVHILGAADNPAAKSKSWVNWSGLATLITAAAKPSLVLDQLLSVTGVRHS